MKGKFIMATTTPNQNAFKHQAAMISATRKLLAKSLGLEVKKVTVAHNYKENTLVFNVEGKLEKEQLSKVEKAKDFIMTMLG